MRTAAVALGIALLCALALAVGLGVHRVTTVDGALASVRTYTQALAVDDDAAAFPATRRAVRLTLPDEWASSRPGYEGAVWYRVAFDAAPAATAGLLALYVERVCNTFDVRLNGHLVHSGGRLEEPVPRECYQAQLVPLPPALLTGDGRNNLLDLRVRGYAQDHVVSRERVGGLSALQVGPLHEIAPIWRARQFWQVTALQIFGLALAMLGVVMIGMGWINRRASYLFYFGLLAIGWAVLGARVWLVRLPVANATAEFLIASAFAPVAGLAVLFLLRYARIRDRRIDCVLLAQCVLLPASFVMAGRQNLFAAATVWYVLLALEVGAAGLLYLRSSWHRQRAEFRVMAVLLLVLATLMFVEMAVHLQLLPGPRPEALRFALPVLAMALSVRLAQLFARTLRASEATRSTLESRIREATEEIERNFAQLSELRVEQVTEKERKRIAADLHDDLGAKLLTIVHTSDSERISTLAREALEEMRLSVRGLTGKPMRVADALADWRAETVSRLGQAGVEAEWHGPTEEVGQLMSARGYVQTTRILREAVSNIIKHSGASHCKVRCMIGERDVGLIVQDNGRGIPLELDGKLDRGHGMASMKHRAKQMQGQCLVESGPGYGTVIRLTLPL